MKDLIIKALDEAFALLEKQVPQTKNVTKYKCISGDNVKDIVKFMAENNIPDSAWFDTDENDKACLCYEMNVQTTDKEKLAFKKRRFNNAVWSFVYKALTQNGYKRTGFNSYLLKEFDDTTVYDMYMAKDFDRLCKYYSLSFIKN